MRGVSINQPSKKHGRLNIDWSRTCLLVVGLCLGSAGCSLSSDLDGLRVGELRQPDSGLEQAKNSTDEAIHTSPESDASDCSMGTVEHGLEETCVENGTGDAGPLGIVDAGPPTPTEDQMEIDSPGAGGSNGLGSAGSGGGSGAEPAPSDAAPVQGIQDGDSGGVGDSGVGDSGVGDSGVGDSGVGDSGVGDAMSSEPEPDAGVVDCTGIRYMGLCWYLSAEAASCQETCQDYGGSDPAAAQYIGSSEQGGDLSHCVAILDLLGHTDPVVQAVRYDGRGLGCHRFAGNSSYWLEYPDLDPTIGYQTVEVVCACRE
jgi:hypothetical protein